jgi:hypothetical protein
MSRQTFNRRVTTLDGNGIGQNGPQHKTEATNASAEETENARFEQLGPFRNGALAIDLAAVAMTAGGVDAKAPAAMIAGRKGVICGIAWFSTAPITAGGASALTLQPAVGPGGAALAAQGTPVVVASGGLQQAVVDQIGGSVTKGLDKGYIPFNEGDNLGVLLSTSHTFAPVTGDIVVYLLIRWAT